MSAKVSNYAVAAVASNSLALLISCCVCVRERVFWFSVFVHLPTFRFFLNAFCSIAVAKGVLNHLQKVIAYI